MKTYRTVFALLALLSLVTATRLPAQGYLHASGTRIVRGNGTEIQLRGMGIGGWMVTEGYMLGTANFADSYTKLYSTISTLIGDANTQQFFRTYRANYITRRDVDSLARWGFNSLRLAMNANLLTPRDQPGAYVESEFALIDSMLSWCEANHIYLILDLHAATGGQNPAGHSDYTPPYPGLWDTVVNRTRTVELWGKLAERYATREWIGGYDILNEPAHDFGGGNLPLRSLYIDITNAIRAVDTNHLLFIEGNWWATDFADLTPPWDKNMAYSFHKYWSATDVGTINYLLDIRSQQNVPLWLGESGENSNQWFVETISLMENNHIGWSWWTHKKFETLTGAASATKPADYNYLLQYWNGQATKPTVQFAVSALNSMAESLKLEHCIIQTGFIDAILRQPFTDATKPFVQNTVPGIIYAADYDMGKNGIAYSDVDYKNTTGSGTWNSGWQYRNDGVDIEENMDIPSNGYDVGWISTGEFLNFTAAVEQAGTYKVTLRAAANASGGKVILKRNGTSLSSAVDIPASGGWQNWEDVELGQFQLTAGVQTFGLYFFFGGFNVSYMDFTRVASAVQDQKRTPTRFALMQNYPDPFNPSTSIAYAVGGNRGKESGFSLVHLAVYDILGREVATLVNEVQSPGEYSVRFDGKGLASGIYLYQLRAGPFVETRRMLLMK